MKLIYLANIRLPTEKAHGIQIMKTCEALAAAGVEVELVVPTRKNYIGQDPFDYYGISKNFTVTALAVPDFVRFGPVGFIISQLWFSERVRWMKLFRSADVIYSRDAGMLLQYVLLGRALVYEAHAKPTFVSRLLARRAQYVVIISKGLKGAYEAAGVASANLVVAPDAVDLRLFASQHTRAEARQALGIPADARVAMYTGHLYIRKGVGTLAQAAMLLPEVRIVFVGGTKKDIAVFSTQWGSQKNISIVGHVSQHQVAQYMRAADVLVLPNSAHSDDSRLYTSPMKLFEYMASGTPIVASVVPAIREALGDDSAYFFAPDDPASLADKISLVFADKTGAEKKAQAARRAAERCTWQARADTILGFISKSHKTFLVIQGAKLGDMVCTTPLFRAIKNNFPGSRLYVAGDAINKEVLEGNPHVDSYLYLKDLKAEDIRAKKIDVALLLNPNPAVLLELIKARVKKIIVPKVVGGFSPLMTKRYRLLSLLATVVPHRMGHYAPGEYLRMLEPLGISVRDTTKELFYSDKARATVEEFMRMRGLSPKRFAIISPSAGNKIKNWPADRFVRVAEALVAKGMPVAVIGGPRDTEEVAAMMISIKNSKDIIDSSEQFSLDELKAFVAQAALFVSVDTGPIYIAEAFGVPTVDITGPIDEREQPPIGSRHKVVVPPARIKPQLHVMNARIYDEVEVRRQLDSITAEMVLNAIDELLVV